ncbi:Calcium-independent phospholipase A2-gamma [Galdieria sulphuraria]|nr:Calcium-independent phospholipase A2-gamma [Galdieria sulphuraria]
MRTDSSLCLTCKYSTFHSAESFIAFISQPQCSNKLSNTSLFPSFYNTTVVGRVSKRVKSRRCLLRCQVPEKKEKQKQILNELWKLGWSLGKFFINVNSSSKFVQDSVGTELDRIPRGGKQEKDTIQSAQKKTLEELESQPFLQLTSTPTTTVFDMQTLEIVSLALNNSKTISRKGIDSVLPYEIQRVLFDAFCKGSSVPSKTSHLEKVGKATRSSGNFDNRIANSTLNYFTGSNIIEDSSSSGNNAPKEKLHIAKDYTNAETLASNMTNAEYTVSLKSDQPESKLKENVKSRYPESLFDSSLRFFSNLANLWNPFLKGENARNSMNSSEIEQLDSVDSQSIANENRTESAETKRLIENVPKNDLKNKGESTYDLIRAANDLRWKEDAAKFLDKDKINQLVRALTEDSEEIQADAATALANLAAILPATRSLMLEFNDNQICQFSKSIICEGATRSALRFRWKRPYRSSLHQTGRQIEVKMSILHLIGSLALCFEPEGRKWRKQACEDKEFVAALKRFSRGASGGYSEGVARCARRALACLGINIWSPRVPGQRGIRVLSFDGGGTRAIMTFEILKYLKRITGCEIHELFDVIGGTSTGGIIAVTLGLRKRPIEEVEALYRELIGKIFTKTPVNTPKLLITRSYYDASILESILKREAGKSLFIDSVTEDNANKVFVVSSIVSRKPHVIHLFRNYTFMEGKESRYEGSVEAQLWEGLRASSAAPTYFSEMRINGELYADGALVANNPTGVAIHETKKLFPNVPLELVVSIGTGRLTGSELPEATRRKESSLGWNDIITYLINSATSTESIHESLEDLLPSDRYFRLNPVTDSIDIDEVRPGKLAKMTELAQQYIRENEDRLELLGELLRPKPAKALHELLFDLFRVRGFYVDSFYQIGDDWYFPENF